MIWKSLLVALCCLAILGGATVLGRPSTQETQPGSLTAADASPDTASTRPLQINDLAVRLLLGVGDQTTTPWDGKVSLSEGELHGVDPWRFREGHKITGKDSWTSSSLLIRRLPPPPKAAPKKAAFARKAEKGGPSNSGAAVTPTGVIVRFQAPTSTAKLNLSTAQGNAEIPISDLLSGSPKLYLGGRVEASLVPIYSPIAATALQEDFPAAANDTKNGAWVAFVAHQSRGPDASEALTAVPKNFQNFVPEGAGDQIKLIHFDGAQTEKILDLTEPGRDLWRPAIAFVDGKVLVVWSENIEGNWDLYARTLDPASGLSPTKRLTTDPGTDTDPQLAIAAGGTPFVAWQAWRGGQADIHLASTADPSKVWNVSNHPANDWHPSIAADPSGRLHVAFDSYRNGNYDVLLAANADDGGPDSKIIQVAASQKFEARPTLAIDKQSRAWIAYEERTPNWGKDFGNIPDDPGTPLYAESAVRVRVVEGDKVLDGGDPVAAAPDPDKTMNAYARLLLDQSGRPHLLFRHRQEAIWGANAVMVVGGVWIQHATTLVGNSWTPPVPMPRSDNLLDHRPALVALPSGPVLAFYASDGRLHREVEHTPDLTRRFYTHSGTPPGVVNNDLFVAAISAAQGPEPAPGPAVNPASDAAASNHGQNENEAVARMRAHRVLTAGKTYQLLRGEFHRHTEISQDGGNDGSLEDMWRYAIDVGALDWIGCGDHDNGGGKEYTWWLTQKTTDLYHNAPAFVPMHTYERSVGYPGGHRNIMFSYRGVRTLPRLVDENGVRTSVAGRDEDAQLLYRYLNELNGICAVHTSGTGMGTDWRENDPRVEPFVEIYQGIRDSYEHLGAPRAAHGPADAIGGWRPLGMVWNALAMQYRIAFQSSSDHVSTHISHAIAIAEKPSREAIFDAFKNRRCYAATDNILLDVRCGDHLMGDEFDLAGPVTLSVLAHGTAPIKRIDIIKDFHYVYSTEPKSERAQFSWSDESPPTLPVSWYYVRVLQQDGQIAWGSPMWINRPRAGGRARQ